MMILQWNVMEYASCPPSASYIYKLVMYSVLKHWLRPVVSQLVSKWSQNLQYSQYSCSVGSIKN